MKGVVPVSALCAIGAAVAVGLTPQERMPQVASGGDVLSVVFGDAKSAISDSMFRKADSYFHGGIDMECPEGDHHFHGHGIDGDEHEGHDSHHGEGDHDHECHADADSALSGCDPWAWINSRIRAPEVHTHLEGEKAVELMPWFWASVKADPHNTEAWTAAAYIASRVIKNKKLAAQILADANEANPNSADVKMAEGRFLYDGGKGDMDAARAVFEQARLNALRSSRDGKTSGLSGSEAEQYLNILDYLSFFAKSRGDLPALRGLMSEAESLDPDGVVARSIASRISALESSSDIR